MNGTENYVIKENTNAQNAQIGNSSNSDMKMYISILRARMPMDVM